MCVRRPKCGIRNCVLRVRSWCVYLIDVGFLPAVAAVMFYLMADTVDNFFLMRENTKKISGQPAYGTELQVTPQEVIDRNKTYVMDDITEFLIKAEPCVPENSTRAGRKKAHKMYDALLLVSTSVANMYNRRILREIYGLYASTQPYRIKVIT
ncbi:uncharacterized protein LOC131955306 [Physella acuta]|uniref:uncharacterized protein LOC131955306 n=1 Tax=Physella acuta TaxID=109671 RepID=UPI0027DDD64C|nr:uncharacterized protein LOC131955306 [Physella acuta]